MTRSLALLLLLLAPARAGVRRVRAGAERGASALEFAIIAAIVVLAASVIGGVVYNLVEDKGQQLEQCANQPIGGEAACANGE